MEMIQSILTLCGGISIIGGAVAVAWKWIKPAIQLSKKVDAMEAAQKKNAEKFTDVEKMFQDVESKQRQTMKCLLALINHQITGNGIEEMKSIRDELMEVIIEK